MKIRIKLLKPWGEFKVGDVEMFDESKGRPLLANGTGVLVKGINIETASMKRAAAADAKAQAKAKADAEAQAKADAEAKLKRTPRTKLKRTPKTRRKPQTKRKVITNGFYDNHIDGFEQKNRGSFG